MSFQVYNSNGSLLCETNTLDLTVNPDGNITVNPGTGSVSTTPSPTTQPPGETRLVPSINGKAENAGPFRQEDDIGIAAQLFNNRVTNGCPANTSKITFTIKRDGQNIPDSEIRNNPYYENGSLRALPCTGIGYRIPRAGSYTVTASFPGDNVSGLTEKTAEISFEVPVQPLIATKAIAHINGLENLTLPSDTKTINIGGRIYTGDNPDNCIIDNIRLTLHQNHKPGTPGYLVTIGPKIFEGSSQNCQSRPFDISKYGSGKYTLFTAYENPNDGSSIYGNSVSRSAILTIEEEPAEPTIADLDIISINKISGQIQNLNPNVAGVELDQTTQGSVDENDQVVLKGCIATEDEPNNYSTIPQVIVTVYYRYSDGRTLNLGERYMNNCTLHSFDLKSLNQGNPPPELILFTVTTPPNLNPRFLPSSDTEQLTFSEEGENITPVNITTPFMGISISPVRPDGTVPERAGWVTITATSNINTGYEVYEITKDQQPPYHFPAHPVCSRDSDDNSLSCISTLNAQDPKGNYKYRYCLDLTFTSCAHLEFNTRPEEQISAVTYKLLYPPTGQFITLPADVFIPETTSFELITYTGSQQTSTEPINFIVEEQTPSTQTPSVSEPGDTFQPTYEPEPTPEPTCIFDPLIDYCSTTDSCQLFFVNCPSPTPSPEPPEPEISPVPQISPPAPKQIDQVLIDNQPVDINTIQTIGVDFDLPGVEGQAQDIPVTVTVIFDDESSEYLTYTFSYNPQQCFDTFQRNECVSCQTSRPVMRDSCTGEISYLAQRFDGDCTYLCGGISQPTPTPSGGGLDSDQDGCPDSTDLYDFDAEDRDGCLDNDCRYDPPSACTTYSYPSPSTTCTDTDLDGICNTIDTDDDNDGDPDITDPNDTNPNIESESQCWLSGDGYGFCNECDASGCNYDNQYGCHQYVQPGDYYDGCYDL